jgi:hypothetical protein
MGQAMRAKVVQGQMPPWFANPGFAPLRNAPLITDADIRKLVSWVDSGAVEGDAADKPLPRHWANGWRTTPDVVVSMQYAYSVPAKGAGEIIRFFIPSPFKEDTWVTSIEIQPGDPSVVHHVILQTTDSMPPLPKVTVTTDGVEAKPDVVVLADLPSGQSPGWILCEPLSKRTRNVHHDGSCLCAGNATFEFRL